MEKFYDAIVVGGGPAGLSAAIYMARARFRVLVIEKEKVGGQITITAEVVNYPGIFSTNGEKLTAEMARQARAFGAEFLNAEVTGMDVDDDYKVVHTSNGDFKTLGIIFAGGAHPRLAGFKGENDFRGHGVAYCATCDGEFFTGKTIFVVGGGYAAVEEGLFLTKYAKKGDSAIRKVVLKDRQTGEETVYEADPSDFYGVFVFVGYAPENALLKGKIDLDEKGYVITDRDQKTNVDGVYAAGDICVKNLRQVVTAVSDGAVAATSLEKYLGSQFRKLNLKRTYVKNLAPKEKKQEAAAVAKAKPEAFLDDQTRQALAPVLNRFTNPILLRLYKDDSHLSQEDEKMVRELSVISDKVKFEIIQASEGMEHTIAICNAEGEDLGLHFHGVPGGHEFNSFILAMYNAAGPGQDIGKDAEARVAAINEKKHLNIAVSLSCTMCPDLVAAAERIAAGNKNITVDVYDLAHYPDMQQKYNIMSVPCMIVNDDDVHFGKKNVTELLDILHA